MRVEDKGKSETRAVKNGVRQAEREYVKLGRCVRYGG